MKIIRLFRNETLIGEGGATSESDLVEAIETIMAAVKGVEGIRLEVAEGSKDELIDSFRKKFERTYVVKGIYIISGTKACVSVEVGAVSEEEAIEKAKELGISDPYIDCYDDYEEEYDEEYDEEYEDDEDDFENSDSEMMEY